jgi:general secretion pathway protein M
MNMSAQIEQLKAQLAPLRAKWLALAPRERQMLGVMGCAIGVTVLFMVAVKPAWKTLQQTPAQLREAQAVLDDMRKQAEEVKAMRSQPPVPPVQAQASLQSATDRLGEGARLRMQSDRAVLSLDKVSGAALASWLSEVRSSARVRPLEANLSQVEGGAYSGTVTLSLSTPSGASR